MCVRKSLLVYVLLLLFDKKDAIELRSQSQILLTIWLLLGDSHIAGP